MPPTSRAGDETGNRQKVSNGGIDPFLEAALAQRVGVDSKEGKEAAWAPRRRDLKNK